MSPSYLYHFPHSKAVRGGDGAGAAAGLSDGVMSRFPGAVRGAVR